MRKTEGLTTETRSDAKAARTPWQTPEFRAAEQAVREAVRTEFPPVPAEEQVETILAALKHERERRGLSLAVVAEKAGLKTNELTSLENGRTRDPSLGMLSRYAEAVGARLELVVADSARPNAP